jgi:hypothetical protein
MAKEIRPCIMSGTRLNSPLVFVPANSRGVDRGKVADLDAIDGRTRDHPCRPRPGDTAGVSHRGDPEEGPRHRRAATARCSAPGRSTDVLLRREYTTPSDPAHAGRCPCGSAPVGPAAGGPSDHPHPLRGRRGDREPDPGAPSRESAVHTGLTFRYCRILALPVSECVDCPAEPSRVDQ